MISMQFKFRMMSVLAILALMFSISGASPVLAAVYMLIDLGTLGGSNSGDISATNAVAINEIGQVIGSSETAGGEIHAFVWENRLMTDLILDGTGSDAIAINGAGQVVGNSRVAGGETHAFLWDNSVVIDLGTLGGRTMIDLRTLGGRYSKASAINEAGQVIGSSETADSEIHAFVWENGTMTALTLGGNGGDAMAINEAGQVVGYSETAGGEFRAFIWENGKMTDLGTLGGNSSAASAINEAGQVIGSSETAGGEIHAFIWESGTMTDLGAAGVLSYATAINEAGQVLGYISVTEFLRHAFVWENGTITNLTLGGNHSIASDSMRLGKSLGIPKRQAANSMPSYGKVDQSPTWARWAAATVLLSSSMRLVRSSVLRISQAMLNIMPLLRRQQRLTKRSPSLQMPPTVCEQEMSSQWRLQLPPDCPCRIAHPVHAPTLAQTSR